MSALTLSQHAEDYLRLRRSLGFKLERAGWLLPQLVTYLEAAGAATVTSELAIAWARQPSHARPTHWAQRLAVARGFARYLQTIIPATEVPPPGVFPARRHRRTPYLWSTEDICRLLECSRSLHPPLRAATHETLFGLLATTGMRIGEAIGLQRGDIDFDTGVTTIREAKFDRTRLVPLHLTVTDALARYRSERDRLCPAPQAPTVFLSSVGTALTRSGVDKTLRQLTTSMGIRTQTVHPRAHDLRHSFAVRTGFKAGEVTKVVTERLGHSTTAYTQDAYHTSCPACSATPPPGSTSASRRAPTTTRTPPTNPTPTTRNSPRTTPRGMHEHAHGPAPDHHFRRLM
jgi:integrase/recombinase XerD